MNRIWLVAQREFKATVLTRAFLLGAVVAPIVIGALAVAGPMLFRVEPAPLAGTLVVVDPRGGFVEPLRRELDPGAIEERLARQLDPQLDALTRRLDLPEESAGIAAGVAAAAAELDLDIDLTVERAAPAERLDDLVDRVAAGELVGVIDAAALYDEEGSTVSLFVPAQLNVKHTEILEQAVAYAVSRFRLQGAGLAVETIRRLARPQPPRTFRLGTDGSRKVEDDNVKMFKLMVPLAFMMLLWLGALVSANYLLTTTIEEKANKVMEVLLSALSPMELMAGKILGHALVGLVMLVMYVGLGIVGLITFAFANLIDWSDLIYLGLYYVMAYFMTAAIMAGVGSAVNELREAQSLMGPATMVLMVPLLLWLPISDEPNGLLATITSFLPPILPFVMLLRVTGSEPVPTWQIAGSLVVGYAATVGMIWMAARIFRVGVLMYGKPPTLRELWRWIGAR